MINTKVTLAGVELKNPVMTASGTFGSGAEYSEFVDLNKLGGVVTKGVANVPWPGNPTPRVTETASGMLNAIGLQNPGIDLFCKRDIPFLKQYDTKIIVNVCGKSTEDYCEVVERLAVSKQEAWNRAASMLSKMRLPDVENIMNSYAYQLSGGMRQRVGIAMAMTFNPELLLADEPTSALDVTTQAQIVRQMMELRDDDGTGIIIVTHNIGVAAYMADQLIVMHHGKVVDHGTREEVLNNPTSDYTRKLLEAVPEMEGKRYV